MKQYIRVNCWILLLAVFVNCSKKNEDYKDFLAGGEIKYPGIISNTGYKAGNGRTMLTWSPSPDPNIQQYIIYWNNKQDSLLLNAGSHNPGDTVKVLIPNLKEYVYSFTVFTQDAKGHRSIPTDINNVKVFGAAYQQALLNRGYNADSAAVVYADGRVKLNFNTPDTINITTRIRYTNTSDVVVEKMLAPDQDSIILPDFKFGTTVQYRSSYIPIAGAIDTFTVTQYDDFPPIKRIVLCDKSLFQAMFLPGDLGDAYGWYLYYLWDNSTNEPGFHTQNQTAPVSFTFDMGATAKLNYFKLWQRMSGLYNYGNLKRFEVWGSNNPNTDGSWDSWTMLGSFTSVKPSGLPTGQNSDADTRFAEAGEPFLFPANVPSVRYLRFKVLESWGQTNYYHLIELSFYKED